MKLNVRFVRSSNQQNGAASKYNSAEHRAARLVNHQAHSYVARLLGSSIIYPNVFDVFMVFVEIELKGSGKTKVMVTRNVYRTPDDELNKE
jgi:hypothetical protein